MSTHDSVCINVDKWFCVSDHCYVFMAYCRHWMMLVTSYLSVISWIMLFIFQIKDKSIMILYSCYNSYVILITILRYSLNRMKQKTILNMHTKSHGYIDFSIVSKYSLSFYTPSFRNEPSADRVTVSLPYYRDCLISISSTNFLASISNYFLKLVFYIYDLP